jgi:NADH dehydrogenase
MRVTVTGATGLIGRRLVAALRDRGDDVRCLVRDRKRGSHVAALGAEVVEGDVTDAASVRIAAQGCDVVVHLVAIVEGSREQFERVMKQGTRNVVAAAKEVDVRRFVHMSALGVSERTRTLTPYFEAKWDMEQTVQRSGLEYVIFRPSFVFGRDGGVLATFVRVARWAPVTPIVGPGTERIQPIWADDVGAYFAAGVDATDAANRTFEIGGPDVVTWDEFWQRLKRTLRVRRPSLHLPYRLMNAQAAVTERLPGAPVSRDQLKMLAAGDNVVSNTDAVETFGLPLVPLDEQLRRAAAKND